MRPTTETEEQPHVPAQSPDGTGGQFEGKIQSFPEVPLDTTVGSFLFPPIDYGPGGFKDYVKFWESAPVSDRVLSNLITVYRTNRENWLGDNLDRWARGFDNSLATFEWIRKSKPNSDQIRARHDKARNEELQRLEAERPRTDISSQTARSVAMAAQMYRCAGSLSPADQAKVDAYTIRMAREGEPWTVKEIWTDFHLDEIDDRALVDQDIAVAGELHELRKHLNGIDTI